jgi:hypothetical protein
MKSALRSRDNGLPGYRHDYDPGYYGAFALDPDRSKLEARWFDHRKKHRFRVSRANLEPARAPAPRAATATAQRVVLSLTSS